jgi:hypothetical protein
MQKGYEGAQLVVVWLGRAPPKIDVAFRNCHTVATIHTAEDREKALLQGGEWHSAIVSITQ